MHYNIRIKLAILKVLHKNNVYIKIVEANCQIEKEFALSIYIT